jgi:hypothetical protein
MTSLVDIEETATQEGVIRNKRWEAGIREGLAGLLQEQST